MGCTKMGNRMDLAHEPLLIPGLEYKGMKKKLDGLSEQINYTNHSTYKL